MFASGAGRSRGNVSGGCCGVEELGGDVDDDEGAVFSGAVFGGSVEEDSADIDERIDVGVDADSRNWLVVGRLVGRGVGFGADGAVLVLGRVDGGGQDGGIFSGEKWRGGRPCRRRGDARSRCVGLAGRCGGVRWSGRRR